jgi:hypothetical protein
MITIGEQDEADSIDLLIASGCSVRRSSLSNRAPGYRILGLQAKLREWKCSRTKHVPAAYLRASCVNVWLSCKASWTRMGP